VSVYFVASGGHVKIGYSKDPVGRAATVTIHGRRPADIPHGADATLLGWVPGDRDVEAAWHRRFAADHVFGEWFYLDPDLIRGLIWDDPCGVELDRMSALAVFVANEHPGISREQIAATGVGVDAADRIDSLFGGAA
jgi:hypothetical protein